MQAPQAIRTKLQALRAQIAAQKLGFEVGYTSAMDFDSTISRTLQAPPDLNRKNQNAEFPRPDTFESITGSG